MRPTTPSLTDVIPRPVNGPPELRNPLALGLEWVTRITTVAMEMVLPGLGGYWLDERLGTPPIFTLTGFALGLVIGTWHIVRSTASMDDDAGSGNAGSENNDLRNNGS